MYNSFMGIKEEENAIKAVSALIAGTAFTYYEYILSVIFLPA